MSQGLNELLGKDLGSISLADGGNAFAEKVIAAAKKHHINLMDIPELKYDDLDGDGKIEASEIAALIYAAHEKRTGREFQIISSGNSMMDGRAVRNPGYDPIITSTDTAAMTDQNVAGQAKRDFQSAQSVPSVEQLLDAIDKETLDGLKRIRGGIEVAQDTRESSSSVINHVKKTNARTC